MKFRRPDAGVGVGLLIQRTSYSRGVISHCWIRWEALIRYLNHRMACASSRCLNIGVESCTFSGIAIQKLTGSLIASSEPRQGRLIVNQNAITHCARVGLALFLWAINNPGLQVGRCMLYVVCHAMSYHTGNRTMQPSLPTNTHVPNMPGL